MDDIEPVTFTDPARELVELCESLREGMSNTLVSGEIHLAELFEVNPSSLEFFEIIFTIMQRITEVKGLVNCLPMDADYKQEMIGHLLLISSAFSVNSMRKEWIHAVNGLINKENVNSFKAISSQVRERVKYKNLSNKEVNEIIADVEQLKILLGERQISDNDFIRQALIEGLGRVEFRLKRLKWVGWGYTFDGLREVIAAYVMLERSGVSAEKNPDAEAILRKVKAVLKKIEEKLQPVKSVAETGDLIIKLYGYGSALTDGAAGVIALLGNT